MNINRILVALLVVVVSFIALAASLAFASDARQEQDDDPHPDALTAEQEAEQEKAATHRPVTNPNLVGATEVVTAPLFAGIDDTAVPAYQVDVNTNDFYTAFLGTEVWGAAYDVARNKVYVNQGAMLYEWTVGGGPPTAMGVIISGTGTALPMVGLAFYDGWLYGVRNLANEAVYKIDLNTLVATVHIDYADDEYDFGGLAVDPNTGTFYATNDDAAPFGRGLYQINPDGTATSIAPYPAGQTDIDGLALSNDRVAYLMIDEPGLFYVYDFNVMTYTTPLTNPWTSSEVFAGGTWIYELNANVDFTKTVGLDPDVCAATDTISVLSATDVTYCYAVTNTGDVTLTLHNVVDDQLGSLLSNFPLSLGPGQNVWLTATTNITQTTANVATWTASEFFGRYEMDDNAAYNFMDISGTGTPLNLEDDGEANVTMPFGFTFFGVTSNQIRVANNGGIIFDDTVGNIFANNDPLPTTEFQMGILPFWDDLDSDTGNVYYQTMGAAPNRRFVVQWHDRPHFSNSADHTTFQVILYEGSNEILFQYEDVNFSNASWDGGASATVGLQENDATAHPYSHNTASLADGMAIRYSPVTVSASDSDSARVNVEPEIEVDPTSVSSSQAVDSVRVRTLTISNTGTADLDWNIYEYVPLLAPPAAAPTARPANANDRPAVTSAAECAAYESYAGLEPVGYAELCMDKVPSAPAVGSRSPMGATDVTDIAYALDIGLVSDNFVFHQLNDFPGQTVVATNTQPIFAMDFDAAATTLYAIDNTSREFGIIDLGSGAFTPITTVSGIPPADNISGLTIDPATNNAYVSGLSASMDLYSFDLATGVATLIGSDASVSLLIDIAIGPNGVMYGHDISTDSIYTIDRSTGAATLVGPTGVNSNFAQGMDFDNATGTLYAWMYQGGGANNYGTIDLATGALTPLATSNPEGEFEGAVQVAGCTSGDIPWASVNPATDTTPPASSDTVDVTFDATGLADGVYTGTLCLTSNDLDESLVTIPLTLTVGNMADLSLTKSGAPDPVPPGATLTYTLTVANNGPDTATGVTLTDILPSSVTFISASAGCSEAGSVVTCDLGSLASGSDATVVIAVTTPSDIGMLSNTATVTANEEDPDPGNNSAVATTTVGYRLYLATILKQ